MNTRKQLGLSRIVAALAIAMTMLGTVFGTSSAGDVGYVLDGPYALDGNVCPDTYAPDGADKVDVVGNFTTLQVTAPDGFLIDAFCIKAGSDNQGDGPEGWNVLPPSETVTISHSTGKEISHYTLHFVPVEEQGQWCSPGYWKQPHHQDSWAATGYSPDDKYNAIFNPDLPGDPTLLEVLWGTSSYGGGPANKVGDLLSEAHPDVNFLGERIEDSCPLN